MSQDFGFSFLFSLLKREFRSFPPLTMTVKRLHTLDDFFVPLLSGKRTQAGVETINFIGFKHTGGIPSLREEIAFSILRFS
jgi:hypothetical protein